MEDQQIIPLRGEPCMLQAPNEISQAKQEQQIYESGYGETVIVDGVIYGSRSFPG